MIRALTPFLWYAGVCAAAAYGLHLNHQDGYDEGYALAEAQGKTAIAETQSRWDADKLASATSAVNAAHNLVETFLTEQARAAELGKELARTRTELQQTTDRLEKRIANVTTLYRQALDAKPEPLPVAVFTHGFVRVWNNANGIPSTMPAESPPHGVATQTGQSAAADELSADISQRQLLNNHVRNAELHSACRTQLNTLIDWTLNATN